jgi:hypothetical protein
MNSIYDTYLINNVKKEKSTTKESNYKRFFGKKVITCVFTLDRIEPYYLEWFNDTNDLILSNNKMIKNYIYISIKEKFNIDNSSIYYFYKYWRENIPNQISSPLKVIEFIIDKYNEIKTNNSIKSKEFPYFISDFFNNIKFLIEYCKDKEERKKILHKYDEDNFFIENLENKIKYSINRFLKDDENSDEE